MVPMVIDCENCGSEDLMVIKCMKCGGEEFLEQEISQISDKRSEDTKTYAPSLLHLSNSNYEYVCYMCGTKLALPNPL